MSTEKPGPAPLKSSEEVAVSTSSSQVAVSPAPISPCPELAQVQEGAAQAQGGAECGDQEVPSINLPHSLAAPSLLPPAPPFSHDLAPVHDLLLELASDLQTKVDQATNEFYSIKKKLAYEMLKTAESLDSLGEVVLPASPPLPPLPPPEVPPSTCTALAPSPPPPPSPGSSPAALLSSIHQYRDQAVAALHREAHTITQDCEEEKEPQLEQPRDFNAASDRLDTSFQAMKGWLDQFNKCARNLQNTDGSSAASSLRKFNVERCRDIDSLEKGAVLEKMSELRLRSCSLQMRKPVRSLGHTLDLQEIMLLAKNAKSLVYEVSLQMLKIVDVVKGEEIEATTTYHRLTKENSLLLRKYCFYLKLKIWQL